MKVVYECIRIFITPSKALHKLFLPLIFLFFVFPLLKAYGVESIKYDGLYELELVGDSEWYKYLRFYSDGTVLIIYREIKYSETLTEFRKKCAKNVDFERRMGKGKTGKYSTHESNIEISIMPDGLYKGTIKGDELQLRAPKGTKTTYRFISDIDIAKGATAETQILAKKTPKQETKVEKRPPTKKVTSKKKAKTVVPENIGPWITVITHYDNFGHPVRSDLFNLKGELVARKGRIYSGPQLVQTLIAYPGALKTGEICDIDPNKIFFITDHDAHGNPKTNRFLCLDKDGNMIVKDKKPLLVESFSAVQKGQFKNVYDGAWLDLKIWKYNPCSNCNQVAGYSEVSFVF
ncbi:MAG TPA: hypothetical protein VMW09_01520 [Desulfatiglandales bacterium]|nr:hypothetical protein [Desulfatiglandales bacterium]